MTSVEKEGREAALHAELEEKLARWTARGAISPDQAEVIRRIEEDEARWAPAPNRIPLVAQALGFLGGVLAVVAGIVATSRFWDDLPTVARLTLVGIVAVLLVGAGGAVRRPGEPALENLGSFLWLLGTGATAFWAGIAASDGLGWEGPDVAFVIGAVTLLVAAVLWGTRPAPLQHVATFIALGVTVGAVAGQAEHIGGLFVGIALWGLGVSWVVLARLGIASPMPLGYAAGAILAIGAGGVVGGEVWWGDLLVIITALVFLASSVPTRSMVLLWVSSVGMLQAVPTAIGRHFDDSLGAPVVLFLAGASLITVAVVVSRVAPEVRAAPERPRFSERTIAASVFVVVAIVVALTIGLTNIKDVPTFASLRRTPDTAISGSIAFLRDGGTPCVFVMPASGASAPTKVVCERNFDRGPTGLSWNDAGHVLVHQFRDEGPPVLVEVDAATGRIIGRQPANDENKAAVIERNQRSTDGASITTEDAGRGKPRLVVRDTSGGSRTVFATVGPRDYRFEDAVWSPDDRYVVVADSEHRLLVVDVESSSPRARVLITNASWPAWSSWSVAG
jgi:hypothetical protein